LRDKRTHCQEKPTANTRNEADQNKAGIDFEVHFTFVGLRLRAGTLAQFDGYLLARQRE
jgi:hypothetical protein